MFRCAGDRRGPAARPTAAGRHTAGENAQRGFSLSLLCPLRFRKRWLLFFLCLSMRFHGAVCVFFSAFRSATLCVALAGERGHGGGRARGAAHPAPHAGREGGGGGGAAADGGDVSGAAAGEEHALTSPRRTHQLIFAAAFHCPFTTSFRCLRQRQTCSAVVHSLHCPTALRRPFLCAGPLKNVRPFVSVTQKTLCLIAAQAHRRAPSRQPPAQPDSAVQQVRRAFCSCSPPIPAARLIPGGTSDRSTREPPAAPVVASHRCSTRRLCHSVA